MDKPAENKPLAAAADRIRETAKWLTVSLALLGGVIMAGTQLSSVGSLAPGSDRMAQAVFGGGLAAVGTVAILFGTVWTATTPPVHLSQLEKDDDVLKDPGLLQGFKDVEAVKTEYTEALKLRRAALQKNIEEPTQETSDSATGAENRVALVSGVAHNVLQVASYYKVARRWHQSAVVIGAGALISAVGLVIFIWAANPPADVKASTASPLVLSAPKAETISLSAAGREALAASLGESCIATAPLRVLTLGSTPAGPDVLVMQGGCTQTRFVLTSGWGMMAEKLP